MLVKTQDPSGVGAAEDATMKVATNWGRSGVKNPIVVTLQSMAHKCMIIPSNMVRTKSFCYILYTERQGPQVVAIRW